MRTTARTLAALAGLLTACTVHTVHSLGRPIAPEQVRAIEYGVTTLEQVHGLFGEPDERTTAEDGHQTWRYEYRVQRTRGGLADVLCTLLPDAGTCPYRQVYSDLTIDFAAAGVVETVQFSREEQVRSRREPEPGVCGPSSTCRN